MIPIRFDKLDVKINGLKLVAERLSELDYLNM